MTPEERRQYDRDYRQKNKDRIREQRRTWRSRNRSKVTAAEIRRRQRKRQRLEVVEPRYNHPIYEKAIKLVNVPTTNPLWEDQLSVVVLAILDRKNPVEQLRLFLKAEAAWHYFVRELVAYAN